MKLSELQELVIRDVSGHKTYSPELLNMVRNTRGVNAQQRVAFYRSNVKGLHLRVLDNTFPVTLAVLGERYWHQVLSSELGVYGSDSADLNYYGEFVPGLLRAASETYPELSDFQYLGDLAQLEWQLKQTQFVADDPVFSWHSFAGLTPPKQLSAKILLSASLSVFSSDYPVDAIWYKHQAALPNQEFADAPDGVNCCIYQSKKFDVALTRLSAWEHSLLNDVMNGVSLGELQTAHEAHIDELTKTIFAWVEAGWIVGYESA